MKENTPHPQEQSIVKTNKQLQIGTKTKDNNKQETYPSKTTPTKEPPLSKNGRTHGKTQHSNQQPINKYKNTRKINKRKSHSKKSSPYGQVLGKHLSKTQH